MEWATPTKAVALPPFHITPSNLNEINSKHCNNGYQIL